MGVVLLVLTLLELADILRILDMSSNFVQAIDMRKISQDSIPQRAARRAPQLVEQLVDVPVPQVVTLARGKGAAGRVWCQLKARRGIYWRLSGTRDTQWSSPPEGFTARLGRYLNTGHPSNWASTGATDPWSRSWRWRRLTFLRSCSLSSSSPFREMEVPQIQFIGRVLTIPGVTQRTVPRWSTFL